MLSQETCTNVLYTYRQTGFNEQVQIAKNESIEELGGIVGCAIYYKEDGKEYIASTYFHSDHGDIANYVYEEFNHILSLNDNEDTLYGFITNKGFFLNREIALNVYKHFCANNQVTNNIKLDDDRLYSYHVNWSALANKIVHER